MNNEIWSRGYTDAREIPDAILFTRIAQTVSWCTKLAENPNMQPTLRTEQLQPNLFHAGYDDVVHSVGICREHHVRDDLPKSVSSMPDLCGGGLMVYFPEWNLSDGAAEYVSEGLFDVENLPPWDTWISFFIDKCNNKNEFKCYNKQYYNKQDLIYLLAYVPSELVELANKGIECNPEECIQWMSDADVEIRERLILSGYV